MLIYQDCFMLVVTRAIFTHMWWLKNCCSFSLQKLMQSCSNLGFCKCLFFFFNIQRLTQSCYSLCHGCIFFKNLLEPVEGEDLKASNVKDTDEDGFFLRRIISKIYFLICQYFDFYYHGVIIITIIIIITIVSSTRVSLQRSTK